MKKRKTGLAGILIVVLLASTAHSSRPAVPSGQGAVEPVDATTLGTTRVVRRLTRGEAHAYRLTLAAGECVSVAVEQDGLDVVVETKRADGGVIAEFQDEIRREGVEQVDLVAETAGVYTLDVRPAPGIITPGAYAIHVVSRRPATDADRARQASRALRTAAAQQARDGKLDAARPLLENALAIGERARPADDAYVIGVVTDLAENALEMRDSGRAQALFERALDARTRAGAAPVYAAIVQSRLAILYDRAGDRAKAEAVLRPALDVIETTLGADHLWFVSGLVTLANLRSEAGDVDKAEEIDRRGLAILERIEDRESVLRGSLLNNLGDYARQKGDYARAYDLLQQALAIAERLRGPDSFYVSTTLMDLGVVARQRKDYAAATADLLRALAIRERLEGPDSSNVAQVLINLANVYRDTGDDAKGLETQLRALHILEASSGPYDRPTLIVVGNLARTYAATGNLRQAVAFQRRVDGLIEAQFAVNLAAGSERERLAFVRSVAERTDRTISLHLNLAPRDPEAGALAALVLLQRKGRVLDAMTDTFASVRRRIAETRDRDLLDELRDTDARLAQLVLTPAPAMPPARRKASIAEEESKKERLERELSADSAEFRAALQSVTLDAVQAAIPADAALVEFAVFRPFDPRAGHNSEAYGPPHYAAYVLRGHGAPRGRDLGAAAPVDAAIDALRQALRDPARQDVKDRARDVDERVMRPVRALLGDAAHLLISPDGALNFVPFEALVDEKGRYLIERYATSYLCSGRDLLRRPAAHPSRNPPVIVADPLFGEPAADQGVAALVDGAGGGVATPAAYFSPLAGTAQEAHAIKALFPNATLLAGRDATKAALEHLKAPQILHIASHGFLLKSNAGAGLDNPLLRSGVALAGANLAGPPHEAGLLTALEASSLNLWGTQLVTLSACDTGLGEVRNGEGVFGLRRAFALAGAETVVMSLWPVSDGLTREMMTAYYTGLRAGLGRGDALRRAKLAMLTRSGRAHPFYWASFIQAGEWTPLDVRR